MTNEKTSIDVRIFATLRLHSGRARVQWSGDHVPTVGEVIEWLNEELGLPVWQELIAEDGRIRPGTMLLVGGKNVHHLNGIESRVTAARLDVFPPAGGG